MTGRLHPTAHEQNAPHRAGVHRCPGKIKLYCKGADNVIFDRLAPNQLFRAETEAHLEQLAAEGLRTLCVAMTQLDPAAYEAWNAQYKIAATTLVNRAAEVCGAGIGPGRGRGRRAVGGGQWAGAGAGAGGGGGAGGGAKAGAAEQACRANPLTCKTCVPRTRRWTAWPT